MAMEGAEKEESMAAVAKADTVVTVAKVKVATKPIRREINIQQEWA